MVEKKYIERNRLLQFVCAETCGCAPESCGLTYERDGCEECCEVAHIKSVPVEDVKPVIYSEWIPVKNQRGGHECFHCHEYAPSFQSGEENLSNFCPNCGAEMKTILSRSIYDKRTNNSIF